MMAQMKYSLLSVKPASQVSRVKILLKKHIRHNIALLGNEAMKRGEKLTIPRSTRYHT